jgi:hypothetical protein
MNGNQDYFGGPALALLGTKSDEGKPDFTLLPPLPLQRVTEVLTFGAEKYGADNWQYVDDGERRYLAAALRHINQHLQGEDFDKESSMLTIAHAAASLLLALQFVEERVGEEFSDDRA